MIIAIDFDDTIIKTDRPYTDLRNDYEFMPDAKEALHTLVNAGHTLLLWSARSSLHLRKDWRLYSLWNADPTLVDVGQAESSYELNEARYQAMVDFVERELPGTFAAIDDGSCGKPSVDLFIDDKAIQMGGRGSSWEQVAIMYGE